MRRHNLANYQYVLYEKKGHIASVTINRPEVMNALHAGANSELSEVFTDFKEDDNTWIAILTGAGFEIALACDLIIAAEHARFALPEPRVGLVAGAGGMHRLPQQLPLKLAMGLLLTGKWLSAQDAARYGLVNEVVPAEQLMATAERWASEILECSPLSVRLTKESVMAGLALPVEEAMAADRERLQVLLSSQDFREGPAAFAEKRKPN